MEFISGISPADVWYPDHGTEGGTSWVCRSTHGKTDAPTADESDEYITDYAPISRLLEQKRQNMLKSLAGHLAQLQKFSFAELGSPVFSSDSTAIVKVGPKVFQQFGVCARDDDESEPCARVDAAPPVSDLGTYLLDKLLRTKKTFLGYLFAYI